MVGEILELGVTKLLENFPTEKSNFEKKKLIYILYIFSICPSHLQLYCFRFSHPYFQRNISYPSLQQLFLGDLSLCPSEKVGNKQV